MQFRKLMLFNIFRLHFNRSSHNTLYNSAGKKIPHVFKLWDIIIYFGGIFAIGPR